MENYTIESVFDDEFVEINIKSKDGKNITSAYLFCYKLYKEQFMELKNNLFNDEKYRITRLEEDRFQLKKYNDLIEISNSTDNSNHIIITITIVLKINSEIEKMLDEIIQNC
jgi:hypothetical protein